MEENMYIKLPITLIGDLSKYAAMAVMLRRELSIYENPEIYNRCRISVFKELIVENYVSHLSNEIVSQARNYEIINHTGNKALTIGYNTIFEVMPDTYDDPNFRSIWLCSNEHYDNLISIISADPSFLILRDYAFHDRYGVFTRDEYIRSEWDLRNFIALMQFFKVDLLLNELQVKTMFNAPVYFKDLVELVERDIFSNEDN